MKKQKVTALEKHLAELKKRIDRLKELAEFLTKHPHLAELSDLKGISRGFVGLVIDDRAFVRPHGLKRPGLRMEKWIEDGFTDVPPEDRLIYEDVSQLTSKQLDDLLATIPDPYA